MSKRSSRRGSRKKKVRTTLPPFVCASQSMPYDVHLNLRALEKAITFTWCGPCISLVADLCSLNLGKVDMFGDERIVERVCILEDGKGHVVCSIALRWNHRSIHRSLASLQFHRTDVYLTNPLTKSESQAQENIDSTTDLRYNGEPTIYRLGEYYHYMGERR